MNRTMLLGSLTFLSLPCWLAAAGPAPIPEWRLLGSWSSTDGRYHLTLRANRSAILDIEQGPGEKDPSFGGLSMKGGVWFLEVRDAGHQPRRFTVHVPDHGTLNLLDARGNLVALRRDQQARRAFDPKYTDAPAPRIGSPSGTAAGFSTYVRVP